MDKNFKDGFEKTAKLRSGVRLQNQQVAVEKKLDSSDSLLLFHGLGSGKTLSAINAAKDTVTDFIVPASLRENAKKELGKFTVSNNAKVQSYQNFLKDISEEEMDTLILDEAHRIGNSDTKTSKKIVNDARRYKKRILLTGSPIRNRPSELAPILKILSPDADIPLGRASFEEQFIARKKVSPGIWGYLTGVKAGVEEAIKNKDRLEDIIRGKVSYHDMNDEDFPDVMEEDVQVLMSNTQKRLYSKTLEGIPRSVKYKMKNNLPLNQTEKIHLNSYFNAARQVSNSVRAFGQNEDTPKIVRAAEDIRDELANNPDAKTVSYSNFLGSGVKELANKLKEMGIKANIFDGSLSDKARKRIVDEYNSGETRSLLLSGAGSEGLDLRGTRLVQVLEPHWNQARTDQVKGRAIRYKSHAHLPKEDQRVHIKNYISTLPRGLFGKEETSTDQYMKEMGEKKTLLNKQFLDVLKREGLK